MPRYFIPTTKKEFQEIWDKAITKYGSKYYPETPEVLKDLKVSFSCENFYNKKAHFANEILGLHTLPNGLTFWGMAGGGDWESPVTFIFYIGVGKKIRAYVPLKGNPYNTDTAKAYGNGEEEDEEDWETNGEDEGSLNLDEKNQKKRYKAGTLNTDWPPDGKMMLQDIQDRILEQPDPAVLKLVPKSSLNVGNCIEKLVFYGTGDESYELFSSACSFCYKLVGMGEIEKAVIVYHWAKEMAEFSKTWTEDNCPENLADTENGQWG